MVAIAGDRRDKDIRKFGMLAASVFDRIVIREHDDRRGRAPGEVADLLREAVQAGGLTDDRVTIVLEEIEAVQTAIDLAEPGDLVVAMVYRTPRYGSRSPNDRSAMWPTPNQIRHQVRTTSTQR